MDVKVKYGDDATGFAQRLLSAADNPADVVFSPEGYFIVPEAVADEAGVSYDVENEEPSEAPGEPEPFVGSQEPTEDPAGAEDEDEGSEEPSEPSEEPLRGKALDEALEAEGLSTKGKVAEKQARLAEHLDKE